MRARLILEDGTVFEGEAFGGWRRTVVGEVVFNTGMTGYQEVLTDPSYRGQIVAMTYPLVGNYGIDAAVGESARPQVSGFLVREACDEPNHWRSLGTLGAYLEDWDVPGLAAFDTRALTRHLRRRGTMRGVLTAADGPVDAFAALARSWRPGRLVDEVTVAEPYELSGEGPHIVVVDYGAKANIVRSLRTRGCRVTVVPAGWTATRILALDPDGVLLSNGPGDPVDVVGAPETVAALLGRVPIFGICLGHQLLGLALGARTYKMKFGHRGANHPVKDLLNGRCTITTQNHGYAIDADSLVGTGLEVTHVNLNDGTVEGMQHTRYAAFSVQYHPEAAPGPEDNLDLFDRFLTAVDRARSVPAGGLRRALVG
ncbi:MAG: glutamine-hydrolyzing carbamoyl-phosphate synthase small subunit [Clostridia bacterium]|nr:glutamine-hydrolyzing carbamoyl-phosphate synthase small subunit [Clostridia bacterium]